MSVYNKLASSNDGQVFLIEKTTFRSVFANNSVFNLNFMKVSTENDYNFEYEKNTNLVDNMPLIKHGSRCTQHIIRIARDVRRLLHS